MTKKKIVMGRPKVPKDRAKSDRIQARLTPAERDKIDAAVAKSGLKESAWVRKALIAASEGDIL
jgi:uncharacterized protein (DUF1778 family)